MILFGTDYGFKCFYTFGLWWLVPRFRRKQCCKHCSLSSVLCIEFILENLCWLFCYSLTDHFTHFYSIATQFLQPQDKTIKPERWQIRENKVIWGNKSLCFKWALKSGHSPTSPNPETEHQFLQRMDQASCQKPCTPPCVHTFLPPFLQSPFSFPWPRIQSPLPPEPESLLISENPIYAAEKGTTNKKLWHQPHPSQCQTCWFWKLLLPVISFFK